MYVKTNSVMSDFYEKKGGFSESFIMYYTPTLTRA